MKILLLVLVFLALIPASSRAQTIDHETLVKGLSSFFGPAEYPTTTLVHSHSNLSDGTWTLERIAATAQYYGFRVVVMTDHLDCIGISAQDFKGYSERDPIASFTKRVLETYLDFRGRTPKVAGIDYYLGTCRELSRTSGVLMIPGLEVTLGGFSDLVRPDGPGNIIHLLGIGYTTPQLYSNIRNYLGVRLQPYNKSEKSIALRDAQIRVTRMMHEAGLAVVVAHPYLQPPQVLDWIYTFYKDVDIIPNKDDGVDGVGFFNGGWWDSRTGSDDKSMEAMGIIGRDKNMPPFRDLAPIAEADFHGISSREMKRWEYMNMLSLIEPITCQPERYEKECEMIADAIRDPASTIIAVSSGRMMGGGGAHNLWQRDRLIEKGQMRLDIPIDRVLVDRAIYHHAPGVEIVRCRPDAIANNLELANKEPPSHRQKRLELVARQWERREKVIKDGGLPFDTVLGLSRGDVSQPSGQRKPYDFYGAGTIKVTPLGGRR